MSYLVANLKDRFSHGTAQMNKSRFGSSFFRLLHSRSGNKVHGKALSFVTGV